MIAFRVMDMFSCRSMGAITKSVKALDHDATVRVDIARHWVEIESGWAQASELSDAIGQAGFTPEPVRPAIPKISFAGDVDVFLPID